MLIIWWNARCWLLHQRCDGWWMKWSICKVGGLMSGEVFTAVIWANDFSLLPALYISFWHIQGFGPEKAFSTYFLCDLNLTGEHVLSEYLNDCDTGSIVPKMTGIQHSTEDLINILKKKQGRHFLMKHLHNVLNNCAMLLIWIKCVLFWWHTYSISAVPNILF